MPVEPLEDDVDATARDYEWVARAYDLARAAVQNGNHPFGAVLVSDDGKLAEYSNEVVTTRDVTRHAETGLVALASARFEPAVLSRSTLFTSTEPCIMCCGAIHWAGIARVVYGVTSSLMSTAIGTPYRGIPCREVFERMDSSVTVTGPVSEADGLELHREFWPDFLSGSASK